MFIPKTDGIPGYMFQPSPLWPLTLGSLEVRQWLFLRMVPCFHETSRVLPSSGMPVVTLAQLVGVPTHAKSDFVSQLR